MSNDTPLTNNSSDEGITVTVEGPMTIEQAAGLRVALSDAFSRSPRVTLDISGVTRGDITAIQLLCSACRTAAEKSVEFKVSKTPSCMLDLKRAIGIREAACRRTFDGICLLQEGD